MLHAKYLKAIVLGADSPILKNKCTTVFVPENNSCKNSYTSMVKNKKNEAKIPSLRYVCLFCVSIVIFWLAFLTLKVEEKSLVTSTNTDLDLTGMLKTEIWKSAKKLF